MILGILLLLFLLGGFFLGTQYIRNTWTVASDAARRVLGSWMFILTAMAFLFAYGLPVVCWLLGLRMASQRQVGELTGVDAGRALIFTATFASIIIQVALLVMIDFVMGVVTFLYPGRPFTTLRNGLWYTLIGGLFWMVFITFWLVFLGVYASAFGLALAALLLALVWTSNAYLGIQAEGTLKFLTLSALIIGFTWIGLGSIPGGFWLGLGLPNLQPKINFWSTTDHLALQAAERARWKNIRGFCSDALDELSGQMKNASIGELARKDELFSEVKEACGRGDAQTLAGLEQKIWPGGKP